MMAFLGEPWAFLWLRKKLWLVPIIIFMILLSGLLSLGQGGIMAPLIIDTPF